MKRRELITGSIVLAALALCVTLGMSIEKNKSSVTSSEVVCDTVFIRDTVVVHDTVEVVKIKTKKIYIKPKPSKKIDYVYLYNMSSDIKELCSKSIYYSELRTKESLEFSGQLIKEAKDLNEELNEYKSHLIYTD